MELSRRGTMERTKRRFPNRAVWLAMATLGLGGCMEYDVESTLNADGSGSRSVRIEATDADDLQEFGLTTEDVSELLFLSERRGWSHEIQNESGDTTHVFTRARQVEELGDWAGIGGDLRISGALPANADEAVGYVTLGNVQFRNRILVGTTRRSDGSASFSYQETFLWEDAVDALVEVIVGQMDTRLFGRYPTLPAQVRGEILGLARAQLWEAVEEGVLDSSGNEEDELWNRATGRTASQGVRVLRRFDPDASEEALFEILNVFSSEWEEALFEELMETLPGLNLALNSSVSFTLTMPGRIIDSNAHDRDGTTLSWEFSPADALSAPVVIRAESVTGG
jgi:hypothetical protein